MIIVITYLAQAVAVLGGAGAAVGVYHALEDGDIVLGVVAAAFWFFTAGVFEAAAKDRAAMRGLVR